MPATGLSDTRRALLASVVCVPLSLVRSAALTTVLVLGLWSATAGGDVGSDVSTAGRVATAVWLASYGVHITALGGTWSLLPMTLAALSAWSCHRAGRRGLRELGTLPRGAALAFFAVFWLGHVAVVSVAAWWMSHSGVTASPWQAAVACAVGVLLICLWLAARDPRAALITVQVPEVLAAALVTARRTLASLLLVCAAALAISVLAHWGEAAAMAQSYGSGAAVAVGLWVVSALIAPNAAVWGAGFLLGAPVAVHATQTVSVFAGQATKLPPLPLLAAFPQQPPAWAPALLLIPVVLAAGFALAATPASVRGVGPLITFGLSTAGIAGVLAAAAAFLSSGALAYQGWPHLGLDWRAAAMAAALTGAGGGLGAWWASRRAAAERT